jgi:hypothetical protein
MYIILKSAFWTVTVILGMILSSHVQFVDGVNEQTEPIQKDGLEGSWTLVFGEAEGSVFASVPPVGFRLASLGEPQFKTGSRGNPKGPPARALTEYYTFSKGRLEVTPAFAGRSGRVFKYVLHPKKREGTLDLLGEGDIQPKNLQCIYFLKDDVLIICAGEKRPERIASPPGSGIELWVLTRGKLDSNSK